MKELHPLQGPAWITRKRMPEDMMETELLKQLGLSGGWGDFPAPMLVTTMLPEARVLLCNRAAEALLGTGGLRDQSALSLVHPEDRASLSRTLAKQLLLQAEFRALLPDGSVRFLELRGSRRALADGTAVALSTLTDVTRWQQTHRRLWEERTALRAELDRRTSLLESLPCVMATLALGPDGAPRVVDCAGQSAELLKVRAEDCTRLRGAGAEDYIHPADRARVRRSLLESIRSGLTCGVSFRFLQGEEYQWLYMTIRRAGMQAGTPVLRALLLPLPEEMQPISCPQA